MEKVSLGLSVLFLVLATACNALTSGSDNQDAIATAVAETLAAPTIAAGVRATVEARTSSSGGYVRGVGVQEQIMRTRNHLREGEVIQYNSVPPTSGDHWARWSNCGFFEVEIPDERIVHNLEHSNIVVSYHLTNPEEIDQLREVLNSIRLFKTNGVARLYSKIPSGTVALSAWGVSDTMQDINKGRIERFFETYAGNLGPEGNITCLNTGVMP